MKIANAMRKIRSLRPGECWAVMLLDTTRIYQAAPNPPSSWWAKHSLRALVTRAMDHGDELYDVRLQAWTPHGEWIDRYGDEAGDLTSWNSIRTKEVAALLAFFEMIAEIDVSLAEEDAMDENRETQSP